MANDGILGQENFVGTVLKTDAENRRLAVFIPELMPTMQYQKVTKYQIPTNSGLTLDKALSTNVSGTVTKTNYIWAKSWIKKYPLPDVGSKVVVHFIDESVQLAYWIPFDPNGDNTVIADERYQKQFDLGIAGKNIQVYDDDSIQISVPSNFKAVQTEDEKTKKIDIQENYKFYNSETDITEAINNLQKSVQYMSDQTKATFVSQLNALSPETIADLDLRTFSLQIISKQKDAISSAKNLLDAGAEYSFGNEAVQTISALSSAYQTLKSEYTSAEQADKDALTAKLGQDHFSNYITPTYTSIKNMALQIKTNADSDGVKAKTESDLSNQATITYDFWSDDGASGTFSQSITNKKITETLQRYSQFVVPPEVQTIVSAGNKICHEGYISSVAFLGWKNQNGFDPADAKLVYSDQYITPILFGIYATGDETGASSYAKINLVNDPSYEGYTATETIGTDSPIAITSFPFVVASSTQTVKINIKYGSSIDLTLTIQAQ